MIDRTSLLTRLPWRWGFNSRGLKWICAVSSSAHVRRSREKFDQIRRLITTTPALIGLRSSLNVGESWWTQDLPSNSLNCFTNRSKVKKRREEHRFLKGNSPRKVPTVRSDQGQLDDRDCARRIGGGVRPPSPPRHDTTAPEEPTPARVQPPRQVKTKDAEFHYTKWGPHLATTHFTGLARVELSFQFLFHYELY